MEELISVIIPVYNHANTLLDSLHSLSLQTYKKIEIIIINDGSTDNFQNIIKSFKNKSSLKLKILNQKNLGASNARNRGYDESSGSFVIFWDADTIADSNMLLKMKKTLDKYPKASYVYSQFKFGFKKIKSQKFDSLQLKQNNFIDTTSLLRREDFVYFDEKLKRFQDWDLWLTLLENKKTGIYIPEVLFKKKIGNRVGISKWIPSFFFKLPFKTRPVKEFEKYKNIVLKKHSLN